MKKILPTLLALIIISSFTSELNAQSIRKQFEDREVYQPELKPNYNEELKKLNHTLELAKYRIARSHGIQLKNGKFITGSDKRGSRDGNQASTY